MKYKIVKLKYFKDKYKNLGLNKDSSGLLLNEKNSRCLIMFFNNVMGIDTEKHGKKRFEIENDFGAWT